MVPFFHSTEVRFAIDGLPYRWVDFYEHYGMQAESFWNDASHSTLPVCGRRLLKTEAHELPTCVDFDAFVSYFGDAFRQNKKIKQTNNMKIL